MTIAYILAPNIRYYVVSRCGVPAVGGKLITLDAKTGLPKSTYRDPLGLIPNPPVMDLGSDGSPGFDVYWKVETGQPLYRVIAVDASNTTIYTEPNYPLNETISGAIINVSVNAENYFRNEQFCFWNNGTTFDNDALPIGLTQTADTWYFERTNTDANIQISRVEFPAGDNSVPFSPPYGWRYQVLSPAPDTKSDHSQFFKFVQTLNNQQVTIGIYPKSNFLGETAEIELITVQNFGTGGSTTIETPIQTITVTDSFSPQIVTFVIPSIAGLTIGPDGDDYLQIIFRFNPNLIQDVTIADASFQSGLGTGINYPYITSEEQYAKILAHELLGTSDTEGSNIVTFSAGATGELISVKEAIVNTASEISNMLYCPYMPNNPNQYGQIVDSTTIVTNDDGAYIADGVILQSDGDDVVSKDSFIGNDLNLIVVTAGKKFGVAQLAKSTMFERFIFGTPFGSIVTAFVRAYVSSTATPTFKIALIGWSGTLDQPSKQVVSSWNPAGTNPTLSAGWSYISVTDDLTLLNDDEIPFVLEGADLTTSFNNIGIFCWVDSEDMLVDESFSLTEWGVNQGWVAFQPYRPNQQESLKQAKYYLKKSYNTDDPRAWGYQNDKLALNLPCTLARKDAILSPSDALGYNGAISPFIFEGFGGFAGCIGTSQFFTTINIGSMARTPDVTFYNPTMTAPSADPSLNYAHLYNVFALPGGSFVAQGGSFEIPISVSIATPFTVTSECPFNFYYFDYSTTGDERGEVSDLTVFVNYVADATIGV